MSDKAIGQILVGLDGSDGSVAALRRAIQLAKAMDAEVVAVHVFQVPYPAVAPVAGGAPMGVGAEVTSYEQSMRESVKEVFRTQWCAPLEEAGVRHREVFGEGPAGPVLEEAAERDNVDLIVVGRRGRSSLAEFLAGSVSQYLVHRASRPVLVVPHPSE